ncbi:type IV inositol polyphosphate 5-phosphatase 9 [Euphorbia lathyris]|uniref:type IV inositol polyphosphate 5-phosphatase 9 n=1 Tax=Euphorbia lathyris TaxID=212925 RepID=UPI0033139A04
MWPRLVANKILRKRLGSNNFVADFPSNNSEDNIPNLAQSSLSDHQNIDTYNYKVFVSTWNVGGIVPTEDLDISDWLNTPHICDIYVLGFQEIVPLRASNVLGSENTKTSMIWNSIIRKALNKKKISQEEPQGFKCIISKQMVGILISVWVPTHIRPYIKYPSVSCVGCGIMGCLGNKGAVSVRFRLHQTRFCFVCSHLASGGREGDEKHRNSDVAEILSRTSFPRGPSLDLPETILDHERVILFGDLNYRISLPEATTRVMVEKEEWDTLLKNDQLILELMNGQAFEGWHEGLIQFAPTYKYCPNSNVYFGCVQGKKAEKKRAPAWCDRIIWYGEGLKQHLYSRGEAKFSDHRPVKAIFSAEVEVVQTLKGFQEFFLSDRFDDQIRSKLKIASSDKLQCHDGRLSFHL